MKNTALFASLPWNLVGIWQTKKRLKIGEELTKNTELAHLVVLGNTSYLLPSIRVHHVQLPRSLLGNQIYFYFHVVLLLFPI